MRNVLSWRVALDQGFEPRVYPYVADKVPMGTMQAKLDFKIWSKNAIGINCYFTSVSTGQKFQLTVFRNEITKQYIIKGGTLDFATCPIEIVYEIEVGVNGKQRVLFLAATPI